MNVLREYINGDYKVSLYEDGTKIRTKLNDKNAVVLPDSIDLKITNWCDAGCAYCHEQSTKFGNHGDLQTIKNIITQMIAGSELAIGGGHPLSHPNIEEILEHAKKCGVICNMTINSKHLFPDETSNTTVLDQIIDFQNKKLLYGVGISVSHDFPWIFEYHYKINTFIPTAQSERLKEIKNVVWHIICGVMSVETLSSYLNDKVSKQNILRAGGNNLLLLGYKQHGFGKKYYKTKSVEQSLKKWNYFLGQIFKSANVSFDNLAIKQLDIQKRMTQDQWDKFYMGKDGEFTMYIDAVEKQYCVSSTEDYIYRRNMDNKILVEMFADIRKSQGF